MDKTTIKIGSDFSGVGAFNQALRRLGIQYDELFACDMDKYARQTFELNYGKPKDFPKDVYEREIPKESLDIYMTSPPCQAFSMAGKRLGKEDKRGILFFNSLEFIQENKPRYFIFENVKGLLSHDKTDKKKEFGNTFQEWINYLGGKSVNGIHTFFPYEDSVPYHIYFQVLNAKDYNIPQNRERIFIIGIRDDEDNNFQFPKPIPLTKRLKDVLEPEVDEKYFLSDKMINGFIKHKLRHDQKGTGFSFKPKNENDIGNALRANAAICATDNMLKIIGYTRDAKGKVTSRHDKDISGTIHTASGGGGNTDQFVKVEAKFGNKRLNETLNTKNIPDEDWIIDSYNKTFHKEVSPTIQTTIDSANMHHVKVGTWRTHEDGKGFREMEDNLCPTIPARAREDGSGQPVIKIGAIRGRNPENPKSRQSGLETEQMLEINENGTSNALTTVQKDNVVVIDEIINPLKDKTDYGWHFEQAVYDSNGITRSLKSTEGSGNKPKVIIDANTSKGYDESEEDSINFSVPNSKTRRGRVGKKVSQTLDTQCNQGIYTKQRIRRLTPLECFKLMDFNFGIEGVADFVWNVSDSQAYKQAGNSIAVGVLAAIISKLKL
jgi:DNA (cytosine-5)-methyltransferase 1